MKKTFAVFALQSLLSGAFGCNAGADKIAGNDPSGKNSADTRPSESTDSNTQPKPGAQGTISASPNEVVIPPNQITGAYLSCAVDKIDKETANSVCQLRDEKTNKAFDISAVYTDINWTAAVPSNVKVDEIKNLVPEKNYWHASFTFIAKSEDFKLASASIVYKLQVVRIADGARMELTQKTKSNNRPSFYLQSQAPHNGQALRCLDFSFDQTPDHKGTTRGCNGLPGQHMNFLPNGTIGLSVPNGNQCLTYDNGTRNNFVEPAACNAGNAIPVPIMIMEVVGQELRWKGSAPLCLSYSPDQYGDPNTDYIGMQPCNGNIRQKWEIIQY